MTQTPPHTRDGWAAALAQAKADGGWTVRSLARHIGVPASTVNGWLKATHLPQPQLRDDWSRFMDALGISGEMDDWWAALQGLRGRVEAPSPYVGLRAYAPEEAQHYHGRDGVAAALRDHVSRLLAEPGHGVIVVTGPSGSGKSSLLNTALVGQSWSVDHRLATDEPGQDDVVVVDQAESAFSADDPQRIWDAWRQVALRSVVVVGLRAAYYEEALTVPWLAEALADSLVIPHLSRKDIVDIVQVPALDVGIDVDADVAAAIAHSLVPEDDGHAPASHLSLLSTALLATWEESDRRRITMADFRATGGLEGIIAARAERAWAALDADDQPDARDLLLSLLIVGDDRVTRRPAQPMPSAPGHIIDALATERLIVVSSDGIALSHDRLVRGWPRLQGWVNERREALRARDSLRRSAHLWAENDRDPSFLVDPTRFALNGDPQTFLAASEQEFLQASRDHTESALAAAHRQTNQARSAEHRALVGAGLAVLLAAALAVAAIVAWQTSQRLDDVARASVARQLSVESQALGAAFPAKASLLALQAYRVDDDVPGRSAVVGANEVPQPIIIAPVANRSRMAVLGDAVARGNSDGTVQLWPEGVDKELRSWGVTSAEITGLALMDGTNGLMAAVSTPEEALLIDGSSGEVVWRHPGAGLVPADADPNGEWAFFGGRDGLILVRVAEGVGTTINTATPVADIGWLPGPGVVAVGLSDGVRAWHLGDGEPIELDVPHQPEQSVLALATDNRRDLLGCGDRAGITRVWQVASDRLTPGTVPDRIENWVGALAFSPDGSIAVASTGNLVRVSHPDRPSYSFRMPVVATELVWSGRTLWLGGNDGSLRAYATPGPAAAFAEGDPFQLAASGDGSVVAAAFNHGGGIWLTRDDVTERVTPPDFHEASTAISPDGQRLIVGTVTGELHVYDISGEPRRLGMVHTGEGLISLIRFSDDRHFVASNIAMGFYAVDITSAPRITAERAEVNGGWLQAVQPGADWVTLGAVDGDVVVADADTFKTRFAIPDAFGAAFIAAHPTEPLVAVGMPDGELLLFDVDEADPHVRRFPAGEGALQALTWNSGGTQLVGSLVSGDVVVWSYANGNVSVRLRLPHSDARVNDAVFSASDTELTIGLSGSQIITVPATAELAAQRLCERARPDAVDIDWGSYSPLLEDADYPC